MNVCSWMRSWVSLIQITFSQPVCLRYILIFFRHLLGHSSISPSRGFTMKIFFVSDIWVTCPIHCNLFDLVYQQYWRKCILYAVCFISQHTSRYSVTCHWNTFLEMATLQPVLLCFNKRKFQPSTYVGGTVDF